MVKYHVVEAGKIVYTGGLVGCGKYRAQQVKDGKAFNDFKLKSTSKGYHVGQVA